MDPPAVLRLPLANAQHVLKLFRESLLRSLRPISYAGIRGPQDRGYSAVSTAACSMSLANSFA